MKIHQREISLPSFPRGFHLVTEAIESLKVNLASFIKPKNQLAEILHSINIKAKSFVLVYVPFLEKHHEFVQPDLQFALNKNILSLSENL